MYNVIKSLKYYDTLTRTNRCIYRVVPPDDEQ